MRLIFLIPTKYMNVLVEKQEKIFFNYCIKSVPHAFKSHVSMSINPCIYKAIHVLLMHGIRYTHSRPLNLHLLIS